VLQQVAPAALQLQLAAGMGAVGTASSELALLQQLGEDPLQFAAEMPGLGLDLPAPIGRLHTNAAGPAAVGLLRSAATEKQAAQFGAKSTAAVAAPTFTINGPSSSTQAGPTRLLEEMALVQGALAAPRLLPAVAPEGAEWYQVVPQPRGALSDLVAQPVDLQQVSHGADMVSYSTTREALLPGSLVGCGGVVHAHCRWDVHSVS
jgi:hypothetical protein